MIKNIYTSHKETANNFFWRGLQVFGKQGMSIIIFFLFAKIFSPYDLGIYSYIMASIVLLAMLSDFGVTSATSKYVAEYNVRDKEKLKLLLFNSVIIIVFLASILAIAILLFGKSFFADKFSYVIWALPMIFTYPLSSLIDGFYVGTKRFKELALITNILGLLSLVYFYLLSKSFGVFGALMSQNIFYASILIVLVLRYKGTNIFKVNKEIIKTMSYYSIIIGLGSVGNFLYSNVDILVLGKFGLIDGIAYYAVVYKIFSILLLPMIILATVVAPNVTRLFALKKYSTIRSKMLKESGLLLIFGIIASIGVYFITPFVFKIFFPQYNLSLIMQYLLLLLILVPFRLFSTYISIAYIVSSGHAMITTIMLLIFGFVNLVLDIFLISVFGFIGVIYATLISQFMLILFKDPYFWYTLNQYMKKESIQ